MQSKAGTVEAYLKELPDDRRAAISKVRDAVNESIDGEFEEGMLYGMIGWYVPHSVFPAGYHCDPTKPLCYAALASQKGSMSLYLMNIYGDPKLYEAFKAAWAKTGKKLDMGKSCIRFKSADDLPLDVIGDMVAKVTARDYAAHYAKQRAEHVPKSRAEIKQMMADREKAKAAKKVTKKAGPKKIAKKKP